MENQNLKLSKYSIGTGDRFAHQAKAQLQACIKALESGIEVVPVWNKSNREHTIIGSEPASARAGRRRRRQGARLEAALLLRRRPHQPRRPSAAFSMPCDFYTIDVADFIGQAAPAADIDSFVKRHPELLGHIQLEGTNEAFEITPEILRQTARKVSDRRQEGRRGLSHHLTTPRAKATSSPRFRWTRPIARRRPVELLIILAAIADEGIPVQTIAPKFSGRFNKGVDYVGDVAQFEREFALDVAAIAYAVKHFGLPENLKLSVHSGSDKFSIYPAIHATMKRFNAGVHLKTAGTTWLEELIGLAEAGGDGLALAKEIYAEAFAHREELCAPYATVIDIDPGQAALTQ